MWAAQVHWTQYCFFAHTACVSFLALHVLEIAATEPRTSCALAAGAVVLTLPWRGPAQIEATVLQLAMFPLAFRWVAHYLARRSLSASSTSSPSIPSMSPFPLSPLSSSVAAVLVPALASAVLRSPRVWLVARALLSASQLAATHGGGRLLFVAIYVLVAAAAAALHLRASAAQGD